MFIEKAAGEDRCNKDEGHAWRSKMGGGETAQGERRRVLKRVEEAKKKEEGKEKKKRKRSRSNRQGERGLVLSQGACRCSN